MKKLLSFFLLLAVFTVCACGALADSDGWYCPTCGEHYSNSYRFCPADGTANPFGGGSTGSRSNVSVGSHVYFGSYEQDNSSGNGTERIEWRVLDIQGDAALLLSEYGLDLQLYHNSFRDVTWQDCDMRRWLNSTFMDKAFSGSERSMIYTASVQNDSSTGFPYDRNTKVTAHFGPETQDQVFLLSYADVQEYLPSTADRKCLPTAYAKARGALVKQGGYCWWWLRSPGYYAGSGLALNSKGERVPGDQKVNNDGKNTGLVRPALWVSISALN